MALTQGANQRYTPPAPQRDTDTRIYKPNPPTAKGDPQTREQGSSIPCPWSTLTPYGSRKVVSAPSERPGPPLGPPEPTGTHPGGGKLGRPALKGGTTNRSSAGGTGLETWARSRGECWEAPSDFQAEGDLRGREGDSSLKLGARWGPGPGPRVPLPLPPCLPHPTPSPPPSSLLPSPNGPSHLSSARPHELDPVSPTLNLAMAPHALGRKYGSSPRPTRPCIRQSRPLPGYLSSLQRLVPS